MTQTSLRWPSDWNRRMTLNLSRRFHCFRDLSNSRFPLFPPHFSLKSHVPNSVAKKPRIFPKQGMSEKSGTCPPARFPWNFASVCLHCPKSSSFRYFTPTAAKTLPSAPSLLSQAVPKTLPFISSNVTLDFGFAVAVPFSFTMI